MCACPPRRSPTPASSARTWTARENLIAAHHSVEEIGKIIGADSIGFLSMEACDKLAADSHCGFCKGCFCGKYPVDPPLVTEKNKFDQPIHGGKVQDDD